jgi:hypothetical protein
MAGFSRFGAVSKRLEEKFSKGISVTGLGAFEFHDTIEFRITVPETVLSATMEIFSDATGKRIRFPMKKRKDKYAISVPMRTLCSNQKTGLFYYKYRVLTEKGFFDMRLREYDLTETYMESDDSRGDFQLLIYEKRENPPAWLYGGLFYQIFPDRFFSAKEHPMKENAVCCKDPKKFPECMRVKKQNDKNNLFYGGDLAGITAKLDYLESLGVTCLYLNPIFESSSNHRYNTADYSHVDELLGTEEDLKTLIDEGKKHGISVILDGVFNHTGSDSIYFNQDAHYPCIGAVQSEESQYASWYTFHHYPDRYESWWGIQTLPRVRSDEPSYKEFLFGKNGIVRRYTRLGIAGWRLDVADELSDSFLSELSKTVREEKKDAIVIGEVWEDATNKVSYGMRKCYFNGWELDSVMNYPVQKAIIAYLAHGDFAHLRRTLVSIYGHYPPEAANTLMNLDLKRQDNHNKAQGLLIAFAGLYNSLCRNDDYCRIQTKGKIERVFNDILQLLDKDAFNSISTVVKADIYRRAGMMEFVSRIPHESIDHQSDNRLLDHVKQLARKGITAPVAIGDILSMYDHSSITSSADRYFYHDSIL